MHPKQWITLLNHWVIKNSPHIRESFCLLNPESGNILLVESGILGLRIPKIQLKESENNDWNPESRIQVSTDKGWNPVPGIQNLPRGIENPRPSWIPLHEVEKRILVGSQVLHQQSLNSLYSCSKSVKILRSVPRKLIPLKF